MDVKQREEFLYHYTKHMTLSLDVVLSSVAARTAAYTIDEIRCLIAYAVTYRNRKLLQKGYAH